MTSRDQQFFKLQPSEMAIFQAAANIFASYVATGQVTPKNETEIVKKAISTSITIARTVENIIQSDNETSPVT